MSAGEIKQVQCSVCNGINLITSISFGMQPPSNKFRHSTKKYEIENQYKLSVGLCRDCGVIQLIDRMPVEAIRPTFDWLSYNEPEGHLDEAIKDILNKINPNPSFRFLGVTYKDQSSLDRISRLGYNSTFCIKEKDICNSEEPFGLEALQEKLSNRDCIELLKNKYGKADCLIVRHVIEHATSASDFLRSLSSMVSEGGYIISEFPHCKKMLKSLNHPFVWEEHITYFDEESVETLAKKIGAEVFYMRSFNYPFEDSLMVVLRFLNSKGQVESQGDKQINDNHSLLEDFSEKFNPKKNEWHSKLINLRNSGNRIALFGAGHLAVRFVNFYDLSEYIEFAVDDFSQKSGMFLPGSDIEIISSSDFLKLGINYCISTLSPESEVKVRSRLSDYFESGGFFVRAFSVENNLG